MDIHDSFIRICIGIISLSLCSCDMWDVHPYDTNTDGPSGINATNIDIISRACADCDTLRIVFTGDTQGWLDDTEDLVADVNKRDSIDFLIHVGDLTNYGQTHEFEWQRDLLNHLNVPYVCLIGNHDCLGTGNDVFKWMYGDFNFSFIAGDIKFVCLNTNAMEYDYSNPIPDFDFMVRECTADSADFSRTIICMHARPGAEQFNNNVSEPFRHYCEQFPGLLFCVAGHEHSPKVIQPFPDGPLYYITANADRRSYYLFTITPEGYSYETIQY